ncbi:uncharacterized protein DMAD_00168 [Drosophila madeirensis]|uniref:Uncharacterized protein n=1 Tax=Drosophila madeirensis TaxID=30013 RepID=A0AAU9FVC5_DROMD
MLANISVSSWQSGNLAICTLIERQLQKLTLSSALGTMQQWPAMTAALIYALTLIFVMAAGDELELDYSNEYDDVRPHLVYPDEPRLDKQVSNAARDLVQSISDAWQSMVEELKKLFSDGGQTHGEHEVFSG